MKNWDSCNSYSKASAPDPKSSGNYHFLADSGFKEQGTQSQAGGALSTLTYPFCNFCGQLYHSFCGDKRNQYFNCGQPGHI